MRNIRINIFILVLCAAILAFVSVVHVETHAPYKLHIAADKSFTMYVPGEYKNLYNAEYVRQGYGIPGDTVLGMGVAGNRGLIVIRKILDDKYKDISNEELLDLMIAQNSVTQNSGTLEKIIAHDIVFLKHNSHPGYGGVYITYHNNSIYMFTFSALKGQSQKYFDDEVYQMLNSLVFNPDPTV